MKKTAKWGGKTYEVKPAGRGKSSRAIMEDDCYTGGRENYSYQKLGLFNEHGEKIASITGDGRIYQGGGKQVGQSKIKDSEA